MVHCHKILTNGFRCRNRGRFHGYCHLHQREYQQGGGPKPKGRPAKKEKRKAKAVDRVLKDIDTHLNRTHVPKGRRDKSLQRQLLDAKLQLEFVQNELHHLREATSKTREMQKRKFREALSRLQDKVQMFEQRLRTYDRVRADTIQQLRVELAEVTDMRNKLVELSQNYKQKLDAVTMSLTTCQRTSRGCTRNWEVYKREKEKLMNRLSNDLKGLKGKAEQANTEREKIKSALISQGKTLEQTETALRTLRKEHQDMLKKNHLKIQKLTEELTRYQNLEPDLRRQLNELLKERNMFDRRMANLRVVYENQIKELREEQDVYMAKIRASYEHDKETLKKTSEERFTIFQNMQRANQNEIQQLRHERDDYQRQMNGTDAGVKAAKDTIIHLQSQLSSLHAESIQERKRLQSELSTANVSLEKKKNQLIDLQAELGRAKDEQIRIGKRIHILEAEKRRLENETMKKYAELDKAYQLRMQSAKIDHSTGVGRLQIEIEKQRKEFEKRIHELDVERKALERQRAAEEKRRQSEVGRLQGTIANLHQQLEACQKNHEQRIDALYAKTQALVDEVKGKALLLTEKEKEIRDLQSILMQKHRELESVQKAYDDKIARVETQFARCQKSEVDLKAQLTTLTNEMKFQTTQAEACAHDLASCMNQKGRFEQLEGKYGSMEKSYKETQTLLHQAEQQGDKHKKDFDASSRKLLQQETLVRRLEAQLANARAHEQALTKEVSVLKKAASDCQRGSTTCVKNLSVCKTLEGKHGVDREKLAKQLGTTTKTLGICEKNLKQSVGEATRLKASATKFKGLKDRLKSELSSQKQRCRMQVDECQKRRQEEVNAIKTMLQNRTKELSQCQDQLRKIMDKMQNQERLYMNKINTFRRHAKKTGSNKGTLMEDMKALQDTNAHFGGEMKKVKAMHVKEMDYLRKQVETLERANIQMQTRESSMNNQIERLTESRDQERQACSMDMVQKQKMIRNLRDQIKKGQQLLKQARLRADQAQEDYIQKKTRMMGKLERALGRLEKELPAEFGPKVHRVKTQFS